MDVDPGVAPVEPVPVSPPIASIPPIDVLAVTPKSRVHTGTRMSSAKAYAIRALVDAGFSKRKIAEKEHISVNTVNAIKNSDRFDPQRVDRIKANLSAHFYDTVNRSLETITQEKLDKSSALQLMTVAAIGTDKARLIEGKATSRTEYMSVEDKAVQDEIARLEVELGKWQDGDILNTGCEPLDATSTGQQASPTVEGGANSGK